MRIAMVCPYDYRLPGGVQSHVRGLSESLRGRGHEVTVVAPGPAAGDHSVEHFGRSIRVGFGGTQIDVNAACGGEYRRLKRLLVERDFDVLHLHTVWNPILPLQVLWAARGMRAARVATFHDVPGDDFLGRFAYSVIMPVASWAIARLFLHAVIAVSEAPAFYLRRFVGNEVHVIPNGIHAAAFADGSRLPQFDDGRRNVLFLGRLEPRKGVFHLLDAWRIVRSQVQDVRLIIVGDGPQQTLVESFIQRHGWHEVVLAGRVADAEKPSYYATCDIFCSPAVSGESFGIVLLEAMASGRAIVAAANSGYRTLLPHAMLVPPGQSDALARRLSHLLQDDAARDAAARWGLEAARRYDWREVAQQIEEVYAQARARRA